ncbi:outer membrane beta-barrel protein [Sediminicola luteus]|uniref:Uncharacterized protein n=1 Tax=Sediminicola luteus TaxID=319238 RepID=A0A2A4GF10_9FLAO|nr:outer membrane beta-barrel protein [Sediminicola luteus]PCE66375.1 hypothetical protein B7P33_03510 [Sediminicola luteus]
MAKKDLDRLFQEKFKGFGPEPEERVWERVSASLELRKKKRRALPVWWPLGGVAAALAVVLWINQPQGNEATPQLSDTDKATPTEKIEGQNPLPENLPASEAMVNTPTTEKENPRNNSIANTNKTETLAETGKPAQGAIANNTLKTNNGNTKTADYNINLAGEASEGIALETTGTPDTKTTETSNPLAGFSTLVTQNENTEAKALAEDNTSKKTSIFNAIAEQEDDVLAQNDADQNKWTIGPKVAPVYFDAFGGGSPVAANLAENQKSGDINLSYGLAVGYQVGKKLKISTGINKVDYGYTTDDIIFKSTVGTSAQATNLDLNPNARGIIIGSQNQLNSEAFSASQDLTGKVPIKEGDMLQEMGYIEIPVELNYSLIQDRFGMDLIGGFSSLFLLDNQVSIISNGQFIDLGVANNLNNVNFSANFGLGFNYSLSKKLKLNMEPVFKYQLNTFANTNGSFNPFTLGIYSGLNFRF